MGFTPTRGMHAVLLLCLLQLWSAAAAGLSDTQTVHRSPEKYHPLTKYADQDSSRPSKAWPTAGVGGWLAQADTNWQWDIPQQQTKQNLQQQKKQQHWVTLQQPFYQAKQQQQQQQQQQQVLPQQEQQHADHEEECDHDLTLSTSARQDRTQAQSAGVPQQSLGRIPSLHPQVIRNGRPASNSHAAGHSSPAPLALSTSDNQQQQPSQQQPAGTSILQHGCTPATLSIKLRCWLAAPGHMLLAALQQHAGGTQPAAGSDSDIYQHGQQQQHTLEGHTLLWRQQLMRPSKPTGAHKHAVAGKGLQLSLQQPLHREPEAQLPESHVDTIAAVTAAVHVPHDRQHQHVQHDRLLQHAQQRTSMQQGGSFQQVQYGRHVQHDGSVPHAQRDPQAMQQHAQLGQHMQHVQHEYLIPHAQHSHHVQQQQQQQQGIQMHHVRHDGSKLHVTQHVQQRAAPSWGHTGQQDHPTQHVQHGQGVQHVQQYQNVQHGQHAHDSQDQQQRQQQQQQRQQRQQGQTVHHVQHRHILQHVQQRPAGHWGHQARRLLWRRLLLNLNLKLLQQGSAQDVDIERLKKIQVRNPLAFPCFPSQCVTTCVCVHKVHAIHVSQSI